MKKKKKKKKRNNNDKQEGSLIYWPVIPASLTCQRTYHPILDVVDSMLESSHKKKKQKKNNNKKENKKEFISLAVRVCLCFVLCVYVLFF